MKYWLAVFSATFIFHLTYADQVTCNSGNPDQLVLVKQLAEARKTKGSVTQIIYKSFDLASTEASYAGCLSCGQDQELATVKHVGQTASELSSLVFRRKKNKNLAFKQACIDAANLFQTSTPQTSCEKNPKGVFVGTNNYTHTGMNLKINPCVTKSLLKYQNAVMTSFYNCAQAENFTGLDLSLMFKKYSQESGFRPTYDDIGGLGSTRIIDQFIRDGQTRGLSLIQSIATSTHPDCAAAKLIAAKDLKSMPKRKNACLFIHPGEGLERNFLYSFIGVETVWRSDLEPLLRKFMAENANNPKFKEAQRIIQMTAYGRGGPKQAQVLIRTLIKVKIDAFLKMNRGDLTAKKGTKINGYVSEINRRQAEIAKKVDPETQEAIRLLGADACLTSSPTQL